MKNTIVLSLYERMIIESLLQSSKSLSELTEDSGLKTHLVYHSLESLILQDIVKQEGSQYIINQERKLIEQLLSDPQNIMAEINYLHHLALENTLFRKKSLLKLRKVQLDAKEEKILEAMLINLEEFLASTKKKGASKNARLIYWCQAPMIDLLEYA
jgi:hypothetical protein